MAKLPGNLLELELITTSDIIKVIASARANSTASLILTTIVLGIYLSVKLSLRRGD